MNLKNNKGKLNKKREELLVSLKTKKLILIIILIMIIIIVFKKYNLKHYNMVEKWTKFELNPVLGDDKTGTIFDPYIMKDNNGLYRMYVSWRYLGIIALSLSLDGMNWSKLQKVIEKGNSEDWRYTINRASVIYQDGMYKMWFTGQNKGISKIGFASSEDGYNFKKLNNPVLIPEYSYEKHNVMNPHVIYDKNEKIYKMWYAAGQFVEPDVIGYATSKDGINWEKYKDNPILTPNKDISSLDSFKIGGCDVHKISDNHYLMFYIGYSDINSARIFMAESENGITIIIGKDIKIL